VEQQAEHSQGKKNVTNQGHTHCSRATSGGWIPPIITTPKKGQKNEHPNNGGWEKEQDRARGKEGCKEKGRGGLRKGNSLKKKRNRRLRC